MKMPKMKTKSNNNYEKPVFLKLLPGNHTVRLLPGDQGIHITHTHWINGANIECLDDECPICQNNKRIISEYPDSYRDKKEYSYRREVFFVNVYDRTPVKVCPECQTPNKKYVNSFPSACVNCNNIIVEVEEKPLNKVRILNRGKELYANLTSINNSILDDDGEKIGIENFDLMIMVPEETRRPIAQALAHKNDEIDVPNEHLFDLEEAPLQLRADEIKEFLRGVSLSDIFSARYNESETDMKEEDLEEESVEEDVDETEEVEEAVESIEDDIDAEIEELFS